MGLNDVPSGERTHIVFFGRRNAGKSSLMNAVAGQSVAVVSDVPGTTTDPVRKAMELLPIGPVLLVDTPGVDDEGALGELRIARTQAALDEADIAVLVVDARLGSGEFETGLIEQFRKRGIPYVLVENKIDTVKQGGIATTIGDDEAGCRCARTRVSAKSGAGVLSAIFWRRAI